MSRLSKKPQQERPVHRKLRGYAFDPSLSVAIDTADINDVIYKIRWEEDPSVFGPGPTGEYVEVTDFDPTVGEKGTFYTPVNLNDPHVLASDGLCPSESNPQFHQQFVYAVAMLTIQHFEQALGRQILWAARLLSDFDKYEEYVPRLRIYPHALREANAYYSPLKKAILCGYFSASPSTVAAQMPGSLVFSCLSHDIVAHEVTHAILDGLHRNYNRATNPDVLAFHEAFSEGLDMMISPELTAMATLDYKVIPPGWKSTMPNAEIMKDLLEKTKGRTMIMRTDDLVFERKDNTPLEPKIKQYRQRLSSEERKLFKKHLDESELYVAWTIDV